VKDIFLCHKMTLRAGGALSVARKSQDDLRPTMVRLPEALRRDLEQAATFYGRSLNAEIIYRLEQSLIEAKAKKSVRPEPSLAERLDKIEKTLNSFAGIMRAQQRVAQDAMAALAKDSMQTNEPEDEPK
jgi:Arc-like DNA binding dprotein